MTPLAGRRLGITVISVSLVPPMNTVPNAVPVGCGHHHAPNDAYLRAHAPHNDR